MVERAVPSASRPDGRGNSRDSRAAPPPSARRCFRGRPAPPARIDEGLQRLVNQIAVTQGCGNRRAHPRGCRPCPPRASGDCPPPRSPRPIWPRCRRCGPTFSTSATSAPVSCAASAAAMPAAPVPRMMTSVSCMAPSRRLPGRIGQPVILARCLGAYSPLFVIARSPKATRQSMDCRRARKQRQSMDCFAYGSQ
jgi:hypothetical protein